MTITINIVRNDKDKPHDKLADAELQFIGGELDVICPRPKSKACALIWHSAGRAGQSGRPGPGFLTICAHAVRASSAQHAASTKRVIGT